MRVCLSMFVHVCVSVVQIFNVERCIGARTRACVFVYVYAYVCVSLCVYIRGSVGVRVCGCMRVRVWKGVCKDAGAEVAHVEDGEQKGRGAGGHEGHMCICMCMWKTFMAPPARGRRGGMRGVYVEAFRGTSRGRLWTRKTRGWNIA